MADPAFLVAVTGLSLSGIVSTTRLIGWFLQGDPKAIAQAGRWGATGLFALSLPLLVGLAVNQRWSEAIGLSAVLLMAFALYGPRVLGQFLPSGRLVPDRSRPVGRESDWALADEAPAEAEMVRRSIAVLEDYLRRTTGASAPDGSGSGASPSVGPLEWQLASLHQIPDGCTQADADRQRRELPSPVMSEAEALEVLGLHSDAGASEINEAHRRLMLVVHPDRGGSPYLAVKVNQAKEFLLSRGRPQSAVRGGATARKRRRRDAVPQDLRQSKSPTGS